MSLIWILVGFLLLILGSYLNWREIRRNIPKGEISLSRCLVVIADLLVGTSPLYLWTLFMIAGVVSFLIGLNVIRMSGF